METKEILLKLRTRLGLSQEQLAEQVHVTRQAVSRWEIGLSHAVVLKRLTPSFLCLRDKDAVQLRIPSHLKCGRYVRHHPHQFLCG